MSRQQTGKTSISTIFVRMATILSVPVWLLVLLCALSGVWVLILPILVGWYGALIIKGVFEYFFIHAYVNARMGNDPDYQQWKQAGGDVYFDAQGFPYNFDGVETKLATTLPYPPDRCCPRCGGAWDKWGNKQCGVCYTYWDEGTQMYMYWEPDPRYASPAAPAVDPHDPTIHRGRKP